MGQRGDVEADIGMGVEPGSSDHGTGSIPKSISHPASDGPEAGLPDFTAIILAEMAAAEAAQEATRSPASPLGAGELVLTARELSGLTQQQLAGLLSTSQPTVATIESGNRVPTVRTLMKVAEAAGFELVIGLRSPGTATPKMLGTLVFSEEDGLADYVPLVPPSVFEGPPDH